MKVVGSKYSFSTRIHQTLIKHLLLSCKIRAHIDVDNEQSISLCSQNYFSFMASTTCREPFKESNDLLNGNLTRWNVSGSFLFITCIRKVFY